MARHGLVKFDTHLRIGAPNDATAPIRTAAWRKYDGELVRHFLRLFYADSGSEVGNIQDNAIALRRIRGSDQFRGNMHRFAQVLAIIQGICLQTARRRDSSRLLGSTAREQVTERSLYPRQSRTPTVTPRLIIRSAQTLIRIFTERPQRLNRRSGHNGIGNGGAATDQRKQQE
jgi:hypothetical protein